MESVPHRPAKESAQRMQRVKIALKKDYGNLVEPISAILAVL